MRTIKINRNILSNKKIKLDMDAVTIKKFNDIDGSVYIKITFNKNVNINEGDSLFFVKNGMDEITKQESSINKEVKISGIDDDGKTIIFPYIERNKLTVKRIEFPKEEDEKKFYKIYFKEKHNLLQGEILDDGGGNNNNFIAGDKFFLTCEDSDNEILVSRGFTLYNENMQFAFENNIPFNEKEGDPHLIFCEQCDMDMSPGSTCIFSGSDFFSDADNDCLSLKKDVELYVNNTLSLQIFTDNSFSTNIMMEDILTSYFTNEIKDSSIPEIIDMEKVCFEPCVVVEGNTYYVESITINPHFRKRTEEGWQTSDDLYWNESEIGDDGKVKQTIPKWIMKKPNSVFDLNFTEDDVKYQKNRLKQSFMRLIFYDTNDIFDKQVLFYSTLFFDTGNAAKMLMDKITNNLSNSVIDIPFSFNVTSRHDITKSSEGFYTYFFPDIVKDGKKRIYMTIEFNHAGVGETIPLLWNSEDMVPLSYLKKDGNDIVQDMEAYYKDLFIPIDVFYENEKFSYSFPSGAYNEDTNGIELNIFEPRVGNWSDDLDFVPVEKTYSFALQNVSEYHISIDILREDKVKIFENGINSGDTMYENLNEEKTYTINYRGKINGSADVGPDKKYYFTLDGKEMKNKVTLTNKETSTSLSPYKINVYKREDDENTKPPEIEMVTIYVYGMVDTYSGLSAVVEYGPKNNFSRIYCYAFYPNSTSDRPSNDKWEFEIRNHGGNLSAKVLKPDPEVVPGSYQKYFDIIEVIGLNNEELDASNYEVVNGDLLN